MENTQSVPQRNIKKFPLSAIMKGLNQGHELVAIPSFQLLEMIDSARALISELHCGEKNQATLERASHAFFDIK